MDLRTYPTKRVYETPPFHCTICVEPSEPFDGYIDIGPADILCIPCARRAAAMLETFSQDRGSTSSSWGELDGIESKTATVTAAPAVTFSDRVVAPDYFQLTTAEQLAEVLGGLASTVYPCTDCGRTFTRPAALGSHRRTHKRA